MYHRERLLATALTKYIRNYSTGKGLDERREALLTEALRSRQIPNTAQNRKAVRKQIKEGLEPDQALIDKYVRTFLIGKAVPFRIDQLIELTKGAVSPSPVEAG